MSFILYIKVKESSATKEVNLATIPKTGTYTIGRKGGSLTPTIEIITSDLHMSGAHLEFCLEEIDGNACFSIRSNVVNNPAFYVNPDLTKKNEVVDSDDFIKIDQFPLRLMLGKTIVTFILQDNKVQGQAQTGTQIISRK
ncbi:MAG: hypothetical protein ACK5B6_10125 [Bacteroidia bacterium]